MYPLLYNYARLALPRGRDMHRKIQELLETQWLTPAELQELQLGKIKRLVDHAFNHVPFYREHFQKAGLHPADIKTLADFHQIPTITRQDMKRKPEAFMADNFSRQALLTGMTGGSTGEPLKFYQTSESRAWNWALIQRNRTWFGFQEGMKQAWLWGRDEDIPAHFKAQIAATLRRQKWLTSYDMSEERMKAFAQTLVRFQPAFIFGYASSIYLFAQYLEKSAITGIRPLVIQTAAEKLHDFQRELIEKVFACPVSDHYAALEVGTLADQCLEGGWHLAAETKYFEVTKNDQPVKPGEMGETTVTDLTNYAMPFIRYRGGDLAILDDNLCSCGRGLPLLRELVGRTADFFRMPSGKLVSGLYWTLRMREVPGIRRFRTHQSEVDKIEVMVEIEDGFSEELLEAKRREIISRLNEPISLTFKQVEQIPLTRVGKHLFITSDVPVNFSNQELDAQAKFE